MKLPNLPSFDENEKKTLKRVSLISLGVCILIVTASSIWLRVRMNARIERRALLLEAGDDETKFREHPKDFLKEDLAAHRIAATYFMRMSKPDSAIVHLLRWLSVDQENRLARLQLGEAYLMAGKYSAALRHLKSLHGSLARDSLTVRVMALYGLALFHTEKLEQSIDVLEEAMRLYPESAEVMCYRGQVEAATRPESRAAEQYFQRALKLQPSYGEALYQWARFAMNRKGSSRDDLDSARFRLLKLVLEVEPLNAKAHSRLGMLYYYLGDLELAEKSYKTALTLNPSDYNTHYNLGELYATKAWNRNELADTVRQQLRVKAMERFKIALQLHDSHTEAHFKVGLLCLENNMDGAAIRHLRKAVELAPNNVRYLLQLGVAYERNEEPIEALEVYEQILDIDPVNEVARQKKQLLSNTPG